MAPRKYPMSQRQWQIRVLQWYPFDAAYSMDILSSYAQSVEEQVKTSLDDYKKHRKDWEEKFAELIATEAHLEQPDFKHAGLEGDVKDLDAVFEAYFPSLQRSSALSSIYSVFESELNLLCDRVQSAVDSGLRVQDLAGSGIERARSYLIKVGGFDLSAGEKEWNTVTKVREVRNCFVHSDGILGANDKASKVINAYAKETSLLAVHGNRVEVRDGYLEEVVTAFLRFCEVLSRAAELRFTVGK
jgi:hypothetical protein